MISEKCRKIDELGRIIIPVEMRNALGWNGETKISINREGESVILQTYHDRCFLCGGEENLKSIREKHICQKLY
jgi:transcriptional pleiotropic regulator of transition state genes